MRAEDDDPLLDACLEEILGGERPPDLAARILASLSAGGTPIPVTGAGRVESGRAAGPPPASAAPQPVVQPIPATLSAAGRDRSRRSRHGWPRYFWPAAAAAAVLALLGVWASEQLMEEQHPQPVELAGQAPAPGDVGRPERREQEGTPAGTTESLAAAGPRERESGQRAAKTPRGPEQSLADDRPGSGVSVPSEEPEGPQPGAPGGPDDDPTGLAASGPADRGPAEPDDRLASTVPGAGLSTVSDEQVVATIDALIRRGWEDAPVKPSPPATDAEWCRRVYLDVLGRIPSIEELEQYVIDRARDRKTRLVTRLLDSEEYAEAYARNWATIWTNILIGRAGGRDPDSPVDRAGLQQYLRRSFVSNKPYDRLVFELLSAEGMNRPGDEEFNGAVNFLLGNLDEKAATATAKTGEIFLGVQIQCTQCHNHPFNEWRQNQFWELNAFFRQVRAAPQMQGADRQYVRLEDADFVGEGAQPDPREAEIYYELRNGLLAAAYPRFIDGTAIDPSGLVSEVNRRQELARLVVRSDYLAKAMVNRMWGHFFGYGFTRPVNDMGPHNAPLHPELLERLSREFAAAGYDVERLMQWIVLSEAYGLSSKFGPEHGNGDDDPSRGTPPLFSHFYLRQMTAEQLYESLLVATQAHRVQANFEEQQRVKEEWLEQFTIAFGTDDNGETTTFDGTIAQALMMMNGELTQRATSAEAGSFLHQVAEGKVTPAATRRGSPALRPIQHLYLAALARRPSQQELQWTGQLLASRQGNATTALQDVWWALLNSSEFILNH